MTNKRNSEIENNMIYNINRIRHKHVFECYTLSSPPDKQMDHSILIVRKERKEKETCYTSREKKRPNMIRKKREKEKNDTTIHQTHIFCFNEMKGRKKGSEDKEMKNIYFENFFGKSFFKTNKNNN